MGFGDILTVDCGPTVDFLVFEFSNSSKSRRISLIPLAIASLPLVSRLQPLLLCPSGGWPSVSPSPSVSPAPSVSPSPSVSSSFRVPPVVAAVLATRHHGHGSGTSSKLDSGSLATASSAISAKNAIGTYPTGTDSELKCEFMVPLYRLVYIPTDPTAPPARSRSCT